jgi:hypothetical protein
MKGRFSPAQAAAIFCAIRLTNFSDSITHGPRRKAGVLPPRVTGPIVRGLSFTSVQLDEEASWSPSVKSADGDRYPPYPLQPLGNALRVSGSAIPEGSQFYSRPQLGFAFETSKTALRVGAYSPDATVSTNSGSGATSSSGAGSIAMIA